MKKKKIKLCLTKQLLNMFKLSCEWGTCHATILRDRKLGFFNCKYLQWATLHVDQHVITVKPNHAMLLTKKIFGLCEIFVITFLRSA